MKQFLVGLFLVASLIGFAQKPSQKVDHITLVKERVLKWFKETYVEESFKDPYSYKPLKTVVHPEPYSVKYMSDSTFAGQQLRHTYKQLGILYRQSIDTSEIKHLNRLLNMAIDNQKQAKGKYKESFQTDIDRHLASIQKERGEIIKRDSIYQLKLTEYNKDRNSFSIDSATFVNMPNVDKEKVVYYLVEHDAYGKNSLGNLVLARYIIKYDLKTEKVLGVRKVD